MVAGNGEEDNPSNCKETPDGFCKFLLDSHDKKGSTDWWGTEKYGTQWPKIRYSGA